MSEEKKSFEYSYSSKEQEEIKRIRARYLEKAEEPTDKMEQLRRLDASATKKGTVVSIILGIIGSQACEGLPIPASTMMGRSISSMSI